MIAKVTGATLGAHETPRLSWYFIIPLRIIKVRFQRGYNLGKQLDVTSKPVVER
jgi:hypothetical protein